MTSLNDEFLWLLSDSVYTDHLIQRIKASIIDEGVYESYQLICRWIERGEPELFINDREADSKFLDATTLFQLTLVLWVLYECRELSYHVRQVHMLSPDTWKVKLKGSGLLKDHIGTETLTVPDFKKSLRISVEVMDDQN